MFVWMIRRSRPGGAYSSRKTAAPTPTGIAKNATRPSSQRLPEDPDPEASQAGSLDRGLVDERAEKREELADVARSGRTRGRRAADRQSTAVDHRAEQDREHDDAGQRRQEAGHAEERAERSRRDRRCGS